MVTILNITEMLRKELAARFPTLRVISESANEPNLTIPACHPDVGNISLSDDGSEATLCIGSITHSHFCDYSDDISENERVKAIVDDVLSFLEMLFSDRVLLWKSGIFGGWRLLKEGEEPDVSSYPAGTQYFVWSGPYSVPERGWLDDLS
jgi:hypothetical protein